MSSMTLQECEQYLQEAIRTALLSFVNEPITPERVAVIRATVQARCTEIYSSIQEATGATFTGVMNLKQDVIDPTKIVPADLWSALCMAGKPVLLLDNSITEYTDADGVFTWVDDHLILVPSPVYEMQHPELLFNLVIEDINGAN